MEIDGKILLNLRFFGFILVLLSILLLPLIDLTKIYSPVLVFGLILVIVSYLVYLERLRKRI